MKSSEPRNCLSCDLVEGRRAAIGGPILISDYFHVHQDVAYPIPGLIIVASRRHARCLDHLTAGEIDELLPLLVKIRAAQRSVLNIDHVYYFYNEDTTHHFHVWMVPRYSWMATFGRSIQSVRPALVHARETMSDEAGMAEVERSVRLLQTALA